MQIVNIWSDLCKFKTIYCQETYHIFHFLYMNNFNGENIQAVQVLKALYIKINTGVDTHALGEGKKQRNKCSSIVRLKPNILNQMAYHSSLQRHGGSRMLKTTNPPKTDLLNLNGGSCGYYNMDENVTMTNWMSPLSNDKELFHALSVSCSLIGSCVSQLKIHMLVWLILSHKQIYT